jgi:hypothetical protein
MTMSSAVMPPAERASIFVAQPLAVSLYAASTSRARLLTTLPQMKSSSRGMPEAFTARAKPRWFPAALCAKKLRKPASSARRVSRSAVASS